MECGPGPPESRGWNHVAKVGKPSSQGGEGSISDSHGMTLIPTWRSLPKKIQPFMLGKYSIYIYRYMDPMGYIYIYRYMDPMGYIYNIIYIPPNGKFGKKSLTVGECRGDARFLFGLDCNMPQYAIVMEFLLRSNGFNVLQRFGTLLSWMFLKVTWQSLRRTVFVQWYLDTLQSLYPCLSSEMDGSKQTAQKQKRNTAYFSKDLEHNDTSVLLSWWYVLDTLY